MAMSKSFAQKLRDKGWTIGNESRTWAYLEVPQQFNGALRRQRRTLVMQRTGGRKGKRHWWWRTDQGEGGKFETAEAAFVHAEISNWGQTDAQ